MEPKATKQKKDKKHCFLGLNFESLLISKAKYNTFHIVFTKNCN